MVIAVSGPVTERLCVVSLIGVPGDAAGDKNYFRELENSLSPDGAFPALADDV